MKKYLTLMLSLLLACSLALPASANGWGLIGGIYDIVSDDNRYKDYIAIADDGNERYGSSEYGRHVNHAVMNSRYHNVLIAAQREDKVWEAEVVSTTAVYQPGDERADQVVLTHEGGGFCLAYLNPESGESAEEYYFQYVEGEYRLQRVRYHADEEYANSYILEDGGLLFFQAGPENAPQPIGDALWITDDITLEEFNIDQMPRSIPEVRRLNMVSEALTTDAELLQVTDVWEGVKNGRKLPVYSAPDKASYRSADGKASVGMGGEVEIYGTAEGWTMIRYEVSQRTSRIGWIEGEFALDAPLTFARVPLTAAVNTFLTDDPFVSQYAQTYIPAGAALTGLARCGEYYAYVEYAQGGTLFRGFVPMKDLMTKFDRAISPDAPAAEVCWDVMDLLVGKWDVDAGGSLMGDRCIFFADGTWSNHLPSHQSPDKVEGNFRVYEGGDGSYTLVMSTEENTEARFTLMRLEDGAITLVNEDGEGTYRRDEYSTYGNG